MKARRPGIQKQAEAMRAMRDTGATYESIATRFELSAERVRQILIEDARLRQRQAAAAERVERGEPTLVADLAWSLRVEQLFANHGVKTLDELCALTTQDLMRWPYFGRHAMREVRDALASIGRRLADGPEPLVNYRAVARELADQLLELERSGRVQLDEALRGKCLQVASEHWRP